MEQAVKHRYIVTDDRILSGEPIGQGTRTPVRAVAELWRLGFQPDEINGYIERIGEEETDRLVRGSPPSPRVRPPVARHLERRDG